MEKKIYFWISDIFIGKHHLHQEFLIKYYNKQNIFHNLSVIQF